MVSDLDLRIFCSAGEFLVLKGRTHNHHRRNSLTKRFLFSVNKQLRLEYFIAAAIAIIIILILVLVIVAVLLIRVCRNRSGSNGSTSGSSYSDPATKSGSNKLGSVISLNVSNGHGSKIAPTLSAKMPKHIQVFVFAGCSQCDQKKIAKCL